MPVLAFTVFGVSQPKGSTQSFGYIPKGEDGAPRTRRTKTGKVVPVILTTTKGDNPKTAEWQRVVAQAAMAAMANARPRFAQITSGAVTLSADFYPPRPKSLKDRIEPHTKRPDADKLIRAVADAMTSVAWTDDAQIDTIVGRKRYASPGEQPRAEVTVYPSGEIP
jgi:Holliday junction resolvase RusA-like endonuclease